MDAGLDLQARVETLEGLTEVRVAEPASASKEATPQLCVIVPTKNEAGNVHMLLTRLEGATRGISTQVIFVDDSTDNTAEVIKEICSLYPLGARVIVRPPDRRTDGLGGAVLEGLKAARATWVCVMDGDLQHPPELIPQLLEHAETAGADMVLASRRSVRSKNKGLNPARVLISKSLDILARIMFPKHLRKVKDPLTGFFLARRQSIDVDRLHPSGFKILLEILVRFPGLQVAEVPFEFGARHSGKSKASAREAFTYFSLLWHLRFGDAHKEFLKFALVGGSGVLVNSLAIFAITDLLGVYYLVSAVLASVASTIWNFVFTEYWVFDHRQQGSGMAKRFTMFFVMNNAALLLRGPIIFALTTGLGVYYVVSNLVSLVVMMVARYAVADALIWAKHKPAAAVPIPAVSPIEQETVV